jgi:hypothetical protein
MTDQSASAGQYSYKDSENSVWAVAIAIYEKLWVGEIWSTPGRVGAEIEII